MMLVAVFKIGDCGDSCNYIIEFGNLGNCLVWFYVKAKSEEKMSAVLNQCSGKDTGLSGTCSASPVSLTCYRSASAVVSS